MKIECTKEKLKEAILLAEKITSKNSSLPVLSCVLLEVKEKKVVMKATNLDLGIEVSIQAKVLEEGVVAIPANIFNSYISSSILGEVLVLESVDNFLFVKSSSNETKIKLMNIEDFPNIPKISSDHVFTLSASKLSSGFKSVWYSSSVSSIKPELASVYVYPQNEKVYFVATDSFRLAEKVLIGKGNNNFSPILVPFKNIPEIIKVLDGAGDDEVEIHIEDNQVALFVKGVYLVSRTIEGNFPDYKQILPKESVTEAIVLKEDIMNSLKVATIFSDNFKQVNISVDPDVGICEIKTKNNDIGENTDRIKATVTGKKIVMNFNYKYIADCLSSIPSDSVSFSFSGEGKPVILKGVSDSSFTYLVMPMNK